MNGLFMKYFVLKPSGDDAYAKASRAAMFAYAKSIAGENHELAKQMNDWAADENSKAFARSIDPDSAKGESSQ